MFPGPDGPMPTGEADRAVAKGVDPPPPADNPAEDTLGAGESRPSLGITSEIGRRVALRESLKLLFNHADEPFIFL